MTIKREQITKVTVRCNSRDCSTVEVFEVKEDQSFDGVILDGGWGEIRGFHVCPDCIQQKFTIA